MAIQVIRPRGMPMQSGLWRCELSKLARIIRARDMQGVWRWLGDGPGLVMVWLSNYFSNGPGLVKQLLKQLL